MAEKPPVHHDGAPIILDNIFGDPSFWVFVCLVIFVLMLVRLGLPGRLIGALDMRAAKIDAELEQARKLREDAQKILARAEQDHIEADTAIAGIIESARRDNRRMAETARRELAEKLRRRQKQAEQNIATAEKEAVRTLRIAAADLATLGAALIMERASDDPDERFADNIKEASRRLH